MTIVRDLILQPGLYWVDAAPGAPTKRYHEWREANASTVNTVSTQGGPDTRTIFTFRVKAPTVRWPASAKLGFPNTAKGPTSQSDVVDRPPVQDSTDMLKGLFGTSAAVSGLIVLGVIYLLSKRN